jgi:hypothetical protein
MSLINKAEETRDIAILCQNHRIYLEHAAKITDRYPERRITFRATDTWRSGQTALRAHGPRTIYLAPNDGDMVEYEARLEQIKLEPEREEGETEALLAKCLPETQDQGLWEQYGDRVRTLYVISNCRRIAAPFPYTRLVKLSDEEPVDEHYNYGYVLVHEYCTVCEQSPCQCDR